MVLLALRSLQGFALGVQRLQFAFALPAGVIGLLPSLVQRFQGFSRLAVGQTA